MVEDPIRKLHLLLSKSNKSQVTFVTIKDNSQKSKWCTIGKVNDWIRRYSTNYYIVRGLEGGIHFHLVALLHKHAVLKVTAKGVHFNIQTLNKSHPLRLIPSDNELDDIRKGKYYQELRHERIVINNDIPKPCLEIAKLVAKYWKSKYSKAERLEAKLTKHLHLDRIFSYLDKNLMENPTEVLKEYNTHILKYSGIIQ